MSLSTHTVLVEVVDHYQKTEEPVTARTVAESREIPEETLSRSLETLCAFELLEPTERGYRPTITAKELLALDIELEDVVVLDLVEE